MQIKINAKRINGFDCLSFINIQTHARQLSTSEEPELVDTPRLPCLAMVTPAAAATKADAVDTLNKFEPSPPVPTISTALGLQISMVSASSIIVLAQVVISSIDSPFAAKRSKWSPSTHQGNDLA